MANEFINSEVDKIIKDKKLSYPQNIALASAWIAGNFKGSNLKIFDVSKKSPLADYFLLVTVQNHVQATSIVDEMVQQLRRHQFKIISREGETVSDWFLIDFDDLIVHIFLENSREIYDLDTLWKDMPLLSIPESYYVSSNEAKITLTKKSNDEGYF